MKVKDIIKGQIKDLNDNGMEARHIVMMPRAVEALVLEIRMDADPLAILDRTRGDGSLWFNGLEVIPCPYLDRWRPICVVGWAQAELDLYRLKVAAGPAPATEKKEGGQGP